MNIYKLYIRMKKRNELEYIKISWILSYVQSVHGFGLDMRRVWKLHAMSLVMWTCWNDLGLNLCIVPPMSCVVTISEDSLVRSYKERSKVHCN